MTTVAQIRLLCCLVVMAGEFARTSGRRAAQHGWTARVPAGGRMAVWSR